MPTLTLRSNGVTLREYELSGSRLTIGRRSDNTIQLDDPTVSGIHAVLSLQPDPYMDGQFRVTLVDFNSTNGVFINGERIRQQQLRPGDTIRIGQHELLFDEPGGSPFDQTAVLLREDAD
jgi:pSer/pThr/pTyr-binding forkhead associated (FHA) protein